jgi:hypothetical protein
MELVDGLCWAKQFADEQRDQAHASTRPEAAPVVLTVG